MKASNSLWLVITHSIRWVMRKGLLFQYLKKIHVWSRWLKFTKYRTESNPSRIPFPSIRKHGPDTFQKPQFIVPRESHLSIEGVVVKWYVSCTITSSANCASRSRGWQLQRIDRSYYTFIHCGRSLHTLKAKVAFSYLEMGQNATVQKRSLDISWGRIGVLGV